jgi:uncharacterized metal-binding protein YceD (DUF177 family)
MKIHLKQVPAQGLHLDGDEECPIHDLEAEGIRCAGPLHYNIEVGVAGDALWARGSLSQPVELRCVSCLENFVHDIHVPAFAVHTELPGPETVDLTPFIREDLLLNLPAHPRWKLDWSALDKLKIENR